jgi:hypothetical protein
MHALLHIWQPQQLTATDWARGMRCPSEEANHGQRRSLASKPEEALGNRSEAIAGHRGEPDPLTMARLAGSVRARDGDFKRKAPRRGRWCRFRPRSRSENPQMHPNPGAFDDQPANLNRRMQGVA